MKKFLLFSIFAVLMAAGCRKTGEGFDNQDEQQSTEQTPGNDSGDNSGSTGDEGDEGNTGDDQNPEYNDSDCMIYYTSSDNSIVEPYSDDQAGYFGDNVDLISNTYDSELGKGVILFNAPVTAIGDYAFSGCTSLTSITFPESTAAIGDFVCYECHNLTSITIPHNVEAIGEAAFGYCTNLSAFYGKYATDDNRCLIVDNVLTSFARAGMTGYDIPYGVVKIGGYTFYMCRQMTHFDIPNSVEIIGQYAFYGCGMSRVTIPGSVKQVGEGAFNNCDSLEGFECEGSSDGSLIIDDVFYRAPKGKGDCIIPESVKKIESYAFCETEYERIFCLPMTPPVLGTGVFDKMPSNTRIYVHYSILDIYKAAEGWRDYADIIVAFYPDEPGDDNDDPIPSNEIRYTSTNGKIVEPYANKFGDGVEIISNTYTNGQGIIKFNTSVTTIGTRAFFNSWTISSITIPNSVTTIGESAFDTCYHLENIIIPNSITTIGAYAFFGGESLTSITIPDSVTTIGESAFEYCNLSSITIPKSVTTIGYSAFGFCQNLKNVDILSSIKTIENDTFNGCITLTNITIPNSVTTIGSYAFGACHKLKNITIPNSVTTIRTCAFFACDGLTSISIPDSVTTIGESAFAYCTTLASIYCKRTTPPSLGEDVFYNSILNKIYVPRNSVEAYKTAEGWSMYAENIIGYDF